MKNPGRHALKKRKASPLALLLLLTATTGGQKAQAQTIQAAWHTLKASPFHALSAVSRRTRAQPAPDQPDLSPPAVNPGRPTLTDPAALTAPGWLEAEFGIQQNLDRDRTFATPLVLKLTSKNRRVQYRMGFNGYTRLEDRTDGIGDISPAIQYLFATQERAGHDISGRFALKIPIARPALSTRKLDYSGLLLASRDVTKWGLHVDYNAGLSLLSRQDAPGTDVQYSLFASLTAPLRGGRWQYTNEIVYTSPLQGQRAQVTMMHGVSYAVHRNDVYDFAVQWGLYGDGAIFQIQVGRTFQFGKLF